MWLLLMITIVLAAACLYLEWTYRQMEKEKEKGEAAAIGQLLMECALVEGFRQEKQLQKRLEKRFENDLEKCSDLTDEKKPVFSWMMANLHINNACRLYLQENAGLSKTEKADRKAFMKQASLLFSKICFGLCPPAMLDESLSGLKEAANTKALLQIAGELDALKNLRHEMPHSWNADLDEKAERSLPIEGVL